MSSRLFSVFLCGDVMTGRGVDQILRHPGRPAIHERYVRDARRYVELAEWLNGPIPRAVDDTYIWGDALDELTRAAPQARVVNLESAVTQSDDVWPKWINYRMHPANVGCLTAAQLDVCVLANNHVLDYGYAGLAETLDTLANAGIQVAGSGRDQEEAGRPARVRLADGRDLVVFGVGSDTAGIPASWAAGVCRPGVAFLGDFSETTAAAIVKRVSAAKRPGDIAAVSIHWGSNWGYTVPAEQVRFARWLVEGGVDLVHGHSSHHPRPIEVYRDRLILYGCGDFITDYEGISGGEQYRGDLVLMYFVALGSSGQLDGVRMRLMQARQLRFHRARSGDAARVGRVLSRVSAEYGSRVEVVTDGALELRWG
ncbi:MAG TPA: CapA family protein [Gemmatimonadales bacterium]|nr:CapA family protein [Gemmatimonadales bacterium]